MFTPLRVQLGRGSTLLVTEKGFNAGNITTDLADPRSVLELPGSLLESHVERFFTQVQKQLLQFVSAFARGDQQFSSLITPLHQDG